MRNRGAVGQQRLDQLQPVAVEQQAASAIGDIFAEIGRNPLAAAGKVLGYLQQGRAEPLVDEARSLGLLERNGFTRLQIQFGRPGGLLSSQPELA